MTDLTDEQRETIRALQQEVHALDVKADSLWSEYLKTGDEECFEQVVALDGEAEMKALIAYMPKAGERRIDAVRGLIDKIKGRNSELPYIYESRIRTLHSVNAWRESIGLPSLDRLPEGIMGDASECTIARAIKVGWQDSDMRLIDVEIQGDSGNTVTYQDENGREFTVDLDDWADGWHTVVQCFDDNTYPDLIRDDMQLLVQAREVLVEGEFTDMASNDWLILAEAEIVHRGLQEVFLRRFDDESRIKQASYVGGHFHFEWEPVEAEAV